MNNIINTVVQKIKVGRPRTSTRVITKSSQEGTKENETRATFIVKEDLLVRVKGIAKTEGKMIKELVNEALEEAVAKYDSN